MYLTLQLCLGGCTCVLGVEMLVYWCVLRSVRPPQHLVYCCLWQNSTCAVTSPAGLSPGLAARMGVEQVLLMLLAACAVMPAKDPLLNICMDAKHHKTTPGPEGLLYKQVRLC